MFTKDLASAWRFVKFNTRKYRPEISLGLGIAGVIASEILTVKATRKVDGILEIAEENIENAEKVYESGEYEETYTEEDLDRDIQLFKVKSAGKIALNYLPSAISLAFGLGCIVGSHIDLRGRFMGAAAAYMSIKKDYDGYRERVVERFGEEVDYELKYDIRTETITREITDENGKTKKIKEKVKLMNPAYKGDACFCFDNGNFYWREQETPWHRWHYLQANENWVNQQIQANGFINMNDVYRRYGVFERICDDNYMFGYVAVPGHPYWFTNGIDEKSEEFRRFQQDGEPIYVKFPTPVFLYGQMYPGENKEKK